MGLMDSVSEKLDKASDMLDAVTGGGASGAASGAQADSPVKYEPDEALDFDSKIDSAPVGKDSPQGNKPNPINNSFTEFIHFSQVHPDKGSRFPHAKFDPEKDTKMPEGHAIIFRDALQREAILFHGFVSSCAVVVKEVTENQGGMEQLANMAGNLLGGGGGAPKPDASQLSSIIAEIKSTADTIKPISVTYPNTHEAGKKFHENRNKYAKFCQSLNDFYLKPPKENPVESATKGVIANVPGVGKWINIIMRYAFKLQDLYLAVFLQLRQDHERAIELAAHKITIDALKDNYQTYALTYPVWFKKPDSQTPAAANNQGGGNNLLQPIDDAVKDVKKEVEDIKKDIYGFFGKDGEPEDTAGSAILGEIFGNLKGAAKDTSDAKQPPTASDSITTALNATLSDIGGLPGIMKTVVGKVNDANLGLLEEVFRRLMAKNMDGEINAALMLEAGRRHLSNLVVDVAMTYVKELTGGKIPMGVNVQGMNLSADDLLKKQIYERFSKYIEPILKIAVGDLAGQMEASRKKAVAEKAQTMEVLLGRLPWFTALMFRNTFFPIWNLVVEEVFGEIAPPLKSALNAVNEPINKAKDVVDDVAEKKRRAEKVKEEAMEKGFSAGSEGSNLDKYKDAIEDETEEGKARKAEREQAEKQKDELDKFYKSNDKDAEFPVTGRETSAEGLKVAEKIKSVLPDPVTPAAPAAA